MPFAWDAPISATEGKPEPLSRHSLEMIVEVIAHEPLLTLWRRGLTALLLLALGLVLAACAGGNRPFGKDEGTSGPQGKTVPPIALQSMEGLPAERTQAFRDALSIAAGQRDMAIVEGSFQSGELILNGRFTAVAEGGGVRVDYHWTLTDPIGNHGARFHWPRDGERNGRFRLVVGGDARGVAADRRGNLAQSGNPAVATGLCHTDGGSRLAAIGIFRRRRRPMPTRILTSRR